MRSFPFRPGRLVLPAALSVLLVTMLALLPPPVAQAAPPARVFAPVQAGPAAVPAGVVPYATDRLLVQFTRDAMDAAQLEIGPEKGAGAGARTGLPSLDALAAGAGVSRIERPYIQLRDRSLAEQVGADRWLMLRLPAGSDVEALAARFEADANVEAVSLDWLAFPAVVPNDPLHPTHWGHENTGQLLSYDWATYSHENGYPVGTPDFDADAEAAWDGSQGYGSSGVVIAIIDSGVDVDHPDLRIVAGYDYGDNDSNPDDNSAVPGHGTCCAGVAAARANNALGTAGIAGGCSIMPLKVANSAGSMYFSSIQNALYHCANNGVEIASMSLGAAISSDPATDTAIQAAYNAGVTILAATGNENASTISYPAINAYVIGVGAASPCGERKRSSSSSGEVNPGVNTDPNGYTCDGERWWGSNYGSSTRDAAGAVDVLAPTILPTTDIAGSGGYTSGNYEQWFNGTSCATPYAAGVCALIKSAYPSYTPAQIRARLVDTCVDVTSVESGSGWDRYSGYGMVNAAAAVGGGAPPANTVTVTYPNGGETLTAGDPVTITWTSTGSISTVALDWSSNGGSSWTTITSSTANDGSYGWTVPSQATTAGRVRVRDTADPNVSDTSNANFTIQLPGGGYASLPYSTGFEGGAFDQYWSSVASGNGRVRILSTNTPHSGSYHLVMDSGVSGSYAQTEAWLHLNLSGYTQVDLTFWWKDFGDETHSQDGVYFSANGGASFVKVQDLNGASYSDNTWRQFALDVDELAAGAGLSLGSTFVVKFQQYDNYPITTDGFAFDDISVSGSTGPGNSVTLTAPNGGQTLIAGTTATITWTSTGTIANVGLDWSSNGGSTWTVITSSTANDGSYGWTVPSQATTTARVRVRDAADAGVNDISDANFTIEVPSGGGDYATVPYSTGFEGGTLDQYWTTTSSAAGRIRLLTTNTPHAGSYHMVMDSGTNGTYSQNEAWLHLDLSGEEQVDLSFWWKDFGDETHSQDGVYFSANDGATFVKVQNLNGASYSDNVWRQFTLDVDALAAASGLSLTSTFVVKFQQYDNYAITTDGMAFDDISISEGSGGGGGSYITAETEPNGDSGTSNGPVGSNVPVSGAISSSSDDDWFWFDVATAGNVNISVAIGGSADLDWFLYNSSLTEVARGYTTSNPEAGSYNASVGRYYLRVDGYLGVTSSYTLTVGGGLAIYATSPEKPRDFVLHPNTPNPFNPSTKIAFDLPLAGRVTLRIYDQRGRLVRTLVDAVLPAGRHDPVWRGEDDRGARVASGTYVYRLEAGGMTATRKMTLVK